MVGLVSGATATVAVLLVQQLHQANSTKRVDALDSSDMADPKAHVEALVLPLKADDAGTQLTYSEGPLGQLVTLPAPMVLPIEPQRTYLYKPCVGFKGPFSKRTIF